MPADTPRIAVASPSFCQHPLLRAELLALYPDAKLHQSPYRLEGDALVAFLQGHDVAVVGLEHLTAEIIARLPELRIVAKLGTGTDMLDLAAMRRRGIRLGWAPGANALAIAELVIAFALVSLRHMGALNAALRRGERPAQRMGRLLSGRVVGLHGCGHIGQHVVRLLAPFGCTVLAHDIMDRSAFFDAHGVTAVSLDELLARSEVLSLHIPLTPETRGLYGPALLDRLRPDCVLINTARGEIVDEAALADRLRDGRLAAACADVFATEPEIDQALIDLPNFFATPHIGGSAEEARLAMGRIAIDGILHNALPEPGVPPWNIA
ncbi:phosphoglycerate dehydrogenase [Humitalea sp. 24SJ18S-53]|uniref:phosphoglycerate dehydrogenase n=1 Tax=Humitalea sp. 24SJ18S-53 TaxID=3422307 RepID=UPI003D67B870